MATQKFWPGYDKNAGAQTNFALKIAQNAINQHDDAIVALKQQHDTLVAQVAALTKKVG